VVTLIHVIVTLIRLLERCLGWESAVDEHAAVYFIDHNTGLTQSEDPRGEVWGRPLPDGWELCTDAAGEVYFIDHASGEALYSDPRSSRLDETRWKLRKPDDLPAGWEERKDEDGISYYANHARGATTYKDPRVRPMPPGWEETLDAKVPCRSAPNWIC